TETDLRGACVLDADCDDASPCSVDTCTAGGCSHVPATAAVVCRPSAGACDVAETCTGATFVCPPDAFEPTTTVCRLATVTCDISETCDGSSAACPADVFAPSTTPCR